MISVPQLPADKGVPEYYRGVLHRRLTECYENRGVDAVRFLVNCGVGEGYYWARLSAVGWDGKERHSIVRSDMTDPIS